MKLILEKDVKNLGKAGDKVSVKPGYARNWLLPKKLAVTLNKDRIKEWKHKRYIIEVRKKKAGEERNNILSKIKEIQLVFEKEARSGGQLFGSVSSVEISKVLFEKHNLSVDKRDIILLDPLKTVGEHQVKITLDPTRETFLSINIKKSSSQKKDSLSEEKKEDQSIYKKSEEEVDKNKESDETNPSLRNKEKPKE